MSGIFLKLGTVRAQKSSMLINDAFRYEDKGVGVLCLKPEADTRDIGEIVSRNGLRRPCVTLKADDNFCQIVVDRANELMSKGKMLEAIFIDEGQFLSDKNCKDILLISRTFPVLVYGLKSDFKAKTWESISFLDNFSKRTEYIPNPCQYCTSLAKLNLKLVNGEPVTEGDSIAVDSNSEKRDYVPVCPKCYADRVIFKDIIK